MKDELRKLEFEIFRCKKQKIKEAEENEQKKLENETNFKYELLERNRIYKEEYEKKMKE